MWMSGAVMVTLIGQYQTDNNVITRFQVQNNIMRMILGNWSLNSRPHKIFAASSEGRKFCISQTKGVAVNI
jgi:hypothetical protein